MVSTLLPSPQELEPRAGAFALDGATLILVPAQAGDDGLLAARQVRDEICRATGLALPVLKTLAPPRADNVIRLVCGAEQAAAFCLQATPTHAPASVADQSYTLAVAPDSVTLYADAPAGLFYAAQTLRQLVRLNGARLPALTIRDWPVLRYRGLMLDVSRRKVPTMETLKELVEELSGYKLNVLQLYTEHTFQFPRHPKIGAGCGSFSGEDMIELDAFCRARHVELMPNLQSFGHARNTLLIPEYRHLAEMEPLWTLSPAFEEIYTLLDELYADMLPAFTSPTFNVDCDETWDLGKGASKPLADEKGVGRVYLDHILRVRELAARYGRRIQIWGDILLNHPDLISAVPDDVTLLDWHYDPADEYPSAKIFGDSGRRFWVCPGVGSWNSIFPRLYGANVNIRNFVRDGIAAGTEGMLNTDWGDCGHYQPLGLSLYGYVFGAAQSWTGSTTSDEAFNAAFGPLFFGPSHERIMAALHQLARTNELPHVPRPNASNAALALFDEPLVGPTVDGPDALPAEALALLRTLGEEAAAVCDELAPGHPRELLLREMGFVARLTAYAGRKTAASQEIRRALRDPRLDGNGFHEPMLALKGLSAEIELLRAEFETLWLARARRSEMYVSLGYYAGLHGRYRLAVNWLDEQRKRLAEGQPVDAELRTYSAEGYRILWQTWPD